MRGLLGLPREQEASQCHPSLDAGTARAGGRGTDSHSHHPPSADRGPWASHVRGQHLNFQHTEFQRPRKETIPPLPGGEADSRDPRGSWSRKILHLQGQRDGVMRFSRVEPPENDDYGFQWTRLHFTHNSKEPRAAGGGRPGGRCWQQTCQQVRGQNHWMSPGAHLPALTPCPVPCPLEPLGSPGEQGGEI